MAFGFGLSQFLVGLGALGFEHGADVGDVAGASAGHADVGDINGHDFKSCLGVQPALQHFAADTIGVLQHVLVAEA